MRLHKHTLSVFIGMGSFYLPEFLNAMKALVERRAAYPI